jgi:hypothetical protein
MKSLRNSDKNVDLPLPGKPATVVILHQSRPFKKVLLNLLLEVLSDFISPVRREWINFLEEVAA